MKILHTADWHIGQLFHEYDRTYEHQQFLNWLVLLLKEEAIDVLLVSGDVFDLSNPSAASVRLFYTFLSQAVKANPALQIVITAGNHDSASRLEAPKPLLESSNIHIVGLVEKDAEGRPGYEQLVIPLTDRDGVVKIWCMAVPFLRMGDYPVVTDGDPYAEGVSALYQEVYQYACGLRSPGQAIIAMGHLHAQQAEVTDMDVSERQIMGGVECISAAIFGEDIRYVALGHIHKAQRIGGREFVRYSGSPIPMSFSELNYKHQVIVFELEGDVVSGLRSVEVPLSVALLRVPARHGRLEEVLEALRGLEEVGAGEEVPAPFLEVRVLLDGPEPALRHKIETALDGKRVRLARIDVRYPAADGLSDEAALVAPNTLQELQPVAVFSGVYQQRYGQLVPEEMLRLFNQVAQEVSQNEN